MKQNKRIALVTGANRGIGKEIAKQLAEMGWQVIVTARDQVKAVHAASEIGNGAVGLLLDVTDENSIALTSDLIQKNYSRLDVLINNAGITGNRRMLDFDLNQMDSVMKANFMGAIRTSKYFLPLLRKSDDARIINVSSGMGELDSLKNGGYAAYRLSKTSLNAFTILLASELQSSIKVFAMCPGWVKTDMGGAGASRSVEKGAETAVWLATSGEPKTGKFYRDKKVIAW